MLNNAGVLANVPSRAPTGCSVGTKQGFSIVTYQGNGSSLSVPHGLTKNLISLFLNVLVTINTGQ